MTAKKSFTEPTAAFLSAPVKSQEEKAAPKKATAGRKRKAAGAPKQADTATAKAKADKKPQGEEKAVKSPIQATEEPKAPAGYRYELKPEPKSKRLQLLIQPSVLDEIRAAAKETDNSVNNLINDILKTWIEERNAGK